MRALAAGALATLLGAAILPAPAVACPSPDELAVIGGQPLSDLDDLIDRVVVGSDGRRLGTVEDVTLDDCRTPKDIIVSEGSSGRAVAIPVQLIRAEVGEDELQLSDMTVAAMHALPSYDREAAVTSLGRENAPPR
ncbi:PRC-barrel domain-containing protein [Azospirillum soli]|uniref:PRC-barrel domain-containing protein n=1 Tax=Azospirillum soli TaxID=1304799 RepID=UPI001AE7199E|nr:PRC-barrel domain-containing protein [Azospirillum soli]MBP2312762.1 sporulation protein YlmC with PRC-barrel domain [Azospirillum soli]